MLGQFSPLCLGYHRRTSPVSSEALQNPYVYLGWLLLVCIVQYPLSLAILNDIT